MKIAICSLYINPWYRGVVKYGKRSLELYCKKHGYDFIWETEETKEGVYDGKRDIPWYKILLLLKIMNRHSDSEYDFIVWNDADSMIVNDTIKVEDLISEHMGNKDMLLAKDWLSVLNTGTMFIRNNNYCKTVLQAVWDNEDDFRADIHEQASLQNLYIRNVLNLKRNIVVLPLHMQNKFLTYWYCYIPGECFIFHATRCSHDRAGFIHTMDMYCPLKMDEETDADFAQRTEVINSPVLVQEDQEWYRNGGGRRRMTKRYNLYVEGKLILENET